MAAQDRTFSISMPIGAHHPFLERAVKSLIAQKASVEIAFLDASGDDRVKAVADKFEQHIAFRRHGLDGGQSDAILEGWRNTSGAILGWLNADDILFPGALDKALKAFDANREADLVYGHSTIIDDDFRTRSYHWAVEDDPSRILEGGIISQPSCLFRREAYDRAGGLNADLHYTMDWDLWIRLFRSGAKFQFVDDVWSMVLWAEGTKTSSFNKTRRDELKRIIKEHAPAEKQKKIMRSFAIHNMIDRIPVKPARDAVTRSLIRGRKEINGVSGDGLLQDGASIPLAHYDEVAKTHLVIDVSNNNAVVAIEVNGSSASLDNNQTGALRYRLPQPLNASKACVCTFRLREDASCYLSSIALE